MIVGLINTCLMFVTLQTLHLKRGSELTHNVCNQGNLNGSATFVARVMYKCKYYCSLAEVL